MTEDRLPEVRETDAPPAVAQIYREICEATELPFVNLAWRHMAALPGVLPWVWDIVGAAYRSARWRVPPPSSAVLPPSWP